MDKTFTPCFNFDLIELIFFRQEEVVCGVHAPPNRFLVLSTPPALESKQPLRGACVIYILTMGYI